jgi:hypothetical protein
MIVFEKPESKTPKLRLKSRSPKRESAESPTLWSPRIRGLRQSNLKVKQT